MPTTETMYQALDASRKALRERSNQLLALDENSRKALRLAALSVELQRVMGGLEVRVSTFERCVEGGENAEAKASPTARD